MKSIDEAILEEEAGQSSPLPVLHGGERGRERERGRNEKVSRKFIIISYHIPATTSALAASSITVPQLLSLSPIGRDIISLPLSFSLQREEGRTDDRSED